MMTPFLRKNYGASLEMSIPLVTMSGSRNSLSLGIATSSNLYFLDDETLVTSLEDADEVKLLEDSGDGNGESDCSFLEFVGVLNVESDTFLLGDVGVCIVESDIIFLDGIGVCNVESVLSLLEYVGDFTIESDILLLGDGGDCKIESGIILFDDNVGDCNVEGDTIFLEDVGDRMAEIVIVFLDNVGDCNVEAADVVFLDDDVGDCNVEEADSDFLENIVENTVEPVLTFLDDFADRGVKSDSNFFEVVGDGGAATESVVNFLEKNGAHDSATTGRGFLLDGCARDDDDNGEMCVISPAGDHGDDGFDVTLEREG